MRNKVGMVSLGCVKNQVDAEVMLGLLNQHGYQIVNTSEEADIIIINTCGFIGPAKEESINAILEQAQYKKSDNRKLLVVTGCLSQRYSNELLKEMPEVDAVVGTGSYSRIVEILNEIKEGQQKSYLGNLSAREQEGLPRLLTTNGPSAYLKIAEGCDNCCSYCIIPKIRGRYRSRSIASVVREAEELVRSGIRELIVVAQDVTRYGQDSSGEYNLVMLLDKLCRIQDLKWIRLMYCYPDRISDELMDLMAKEEKICNYLDIPIQHINQRILSRMNRISDSDQIRRLLRTLKERIPNVSLRTSLITGFPGEGEEEFRELMEFVEEGHFQHLGVFSYSQEEGTPAASFPDQVEEAVKEERRHRLLALQARVSRRIKRARRGEICDVLVEGSDSNGLYFGRSHAEAPEIDGLIYFSSKSALQTGTFVRAVITKAFDYDLLGEAYESGE